MKMVVIDKTKIEAASREAAEKKILAKAKRKLFVVCNPGYRGGKRVPGLWNCDVNYEKLK